MRFGYTRVSTAEQNLDLQVDAIRKYGVDELYKEKQSGTTANRPELEKILSKLRNGDTLVIWRLDRLGRNIKQLIELAEEFNKKGIYLVSLSESLDTSTAAGKFCFNVFCAVAQMERDVIAERTKAGLQSARARGRTGGRPKGNSEKIEKALKMYHTQNFSISDITTATGISKTTLYKYLKEGEVTNGI